MAALIDVRNISIIKITLTHKHTAATQAFYFAQDYYAANDLYSGSPEIWPLLAAEPEYKRGVGVNVAIRFDVTIDLWGMAHFDGYQKTLIDYRRDYEFHNAAVVAYYWTDTMAAIDSRQVLTVVDLDYDGQTGIFRLIARDTWFKDKQVGKRYTAAEFVNLEDGFEGEYAPIVFGDGNDGNGYIIRSPFYEKDNQSNTPEVKLFTGWTFTDHVNNAFHTLYAKNQYKDQDPSEWVQVDLPADPQTLVFGYDITSGQVTVKLSEDARALVVSPSPNAYVISHVRFVGVPAGSPAITDGVMTCRIYHAKYVSSWLPEGSLLREISYDAWWTAVGRGGGQLPQQLVVSADASYIIMLEFSNTTDTTDTCATWIKNVVGETHYARDESETLHFAWAAQSGVALDIQVYAIGSGDDDWEDGASGKSYQHLEGYAGGSNDDISKDIEWLAQIKGLEDDGSGTYTGGANNLLENPSDVLRFLLLDDEFGLDHGSGNIATATFNSARTSLAADDIMFSFAIQDETWAQDLAARICRQSCSILYKDRDGDLALYHPQHPDVDVAYDYKLSEGLLRDELRVVAVDDLDYSTVINDMRITYGEDALTASDRSVQGEIFLNDSDSTSSDTGREAQASDSKDLYGTRSFYEHFDLIQTEVRAEAVMNYYFDRYHDVQKRVYVRLPRNKYHAVDLFDSVQLQAKGLPAELTADYVNASNGDASVPTYYNGVPISLWSGGTLKGQVVELTEVGNYINLVIETVSSF